MASSSWLKRRESRHRRSSDANRLDSSTVTAIDSTFRLLPSNSLEGIVARTARSDNEAMQQTHDTTEVIDRLGVDLNPATLVTPTPSMPGAKSISMTNDRYVALRTERTLRSPSINAPIYKGAIMGSNTFRTMIAALQVSLDGFIEGPDGEKDWADSWASAIELIPDVDTFVLGGRMYPGYGEYWESIYANPERVPPFQARVPTKSEIAYARLAAKTPHIVLSKTLKSVSWPAAQIIRDVTELRTLKGQPGKNIYVVGGATLVASLLNENLIDELRLIVHPLVLGKGQALFSGVNKRLSLDLVQARSTVSGRVIVTYRIASVANVEGVSDLVPAHEGERR